jgi:homoserine kinase
MAPPPATAELAPGAHAVMAQAKAAPTAPMVLMRVPGSTSNIGPGFDCLGLALDLHNDFTLTVLGDTISAQRPHELLGRGAAEGLKAEGNPFFQSFEAIYRLVGKTPPRVAVTVDAQVPLGSGLGSSATAHVAGALAANELLHAPFSREELLAPLVAAEGHPDNVTPALLGGLTLTAMTSQGPLVHIYEPAPLWRLVLHIPNYAISTEKARKLLPGKVVRGDAVFNLARLPIVIDALVAGDAAELGRALEDRLHEPYREELIKRHGKLRRAARDAGAAATFISGSGPGLGAFCLGPDAAQAVVAAFKASSEGAKFEADILDVALERRGARIAENE